MADELETPSGEEHEARQIKEILETPVMQKVLGRMKERYELAWRHGKDVQARELAWAHFQVLDGFAQECVAVLSAGKRAEIERGRREQRENSRSRPSR